VVYVQRKIRHLINHRYRDLYPNDQEQAYAKNVMQRKARDSARTPVQWNGEAQAGFTSGKPWMRVNDDYPTVNAEAQLANPQPSPGTLSVHAFWKRGLENRKKNKDVFVYGDFEMLDMEGQKVVAYRRWSKESAFITVLNFSGDKVTWEKLGNLRVKKWVAGNYDERELDGRPLSGSVELRPWEALLGVLE
jgi:oligo-1,6-glucosidase